MTIKRCRCWKLQPESMNSLASKSSKFGVQRLLCTQTKIKDRFDQRRSEVPHPNVIDSHTCGEWVFGRCNPLRQCKPRPVLVG